MFLKGFYEVSGVKGIYLGFCIDGLVLIQKSMRGIYEIYRYNNIPKAYHQDRLILPFVGHPKLPDLCLLG